MTLSAQYMDQPFDGAIDFFKNKLNLPTERWDDLWQGQHARGFVVAGATKTEVLVDIRTAVDKAISKGTTLEEFRQDFDAMVARHGWKYRGGRGWRTGVIYNTNLSTAYAAGHWQRMTDPDMLKARPFLRYIESSSATPRAAHLGWAGTVLPADDPWWQTHYPPNDWGCKCGVTSHSAREVERLKKDGVVKRTEAPKGGTYEWTSKTTGEIHQIPEGIGPGWDYNVGQAGYGLRVSEETMAGWKKSGSPWERLTPGNWETNGRPKRIAVDPIKAAIGPKLTTVSAATGALEEILGGPEKVFSFKADSFRYDVSVNAAAFASHVELDRSPFWPLLPETLEDPFEVWMSFEKHPETGKVVLRQRVIKVVDDGKNKGLLVVAQLNNGRLEAWTMLPAKNINYLQKQREGLLIYGRGKGTSD